MEVPMMGFEPIPRFSQERILSPLRLPFRHIGYLIPRNLRKLTCPKRPFLQEVTARQWPVFFAPSSTPVCLLAWKTSCVVNLHNLVVPPFTFGARAELPLVRNQTKGRKMQKQIPYHINWRGWFTFILLGALFTLTLPITALGQTTTEDATPEESPASGSAASKESSAQTVWKPSTELCSVDHKYCVKIVAKAPESDHRKLIVSSKARVLAQFPT